VKQAFRLDRRNGKILGVCAGISNVTGWDATLVRVAVVVITLLGAFPWTLFAYALIALIANKGPAGLFERKEKAPPRMSARDIAESMRDIDRRMIEVDSYVASPNRRLAEEIDSLR
jgi:phage shock protein C